MNNILSLNEARQYMCNSKIMNINEWIKKMKQFELYETICINSISLIQNYINDSKLFKCSSC